MIKNASKSLAITTRETALKRVKPSRKVLDGTVSRFEKSVTAALKTELASLTDNTRHLENVSAPIRKLIDQDRRALASVKALHKITEEGHKRRVDAIRKGIFEEPATAFNFTADPGWQMLAVPAGSSVR